MAIAMNTLWVLLAIPVLAKVLKARKLASRESTIKPADERVLLLGASSGVGRDLALAYGKRGARLAIFARRQDTLDKVKAEATALGAKEVIAIAGDITSPKDLVKVRQAIIDAWGGVDTVHILAGVPSTSTLMDIAGVPLTKRTGLLEAHEQNINATRVFSEDADVEGIENVAEETRVCSAINCLGTTLSLAAFLPLLARSSKSPVLHHLSSVAATVPAPRRAIYSATKAAGLMAFESCRVECEGSGVRFVSILPGTIDNDFRKKSIKGETGGHCEVEAGVESSLSHLLLPPQKVTDTILENCALNPAPAPLIPYFPFTLIKKLDVPPKHLVHLPWQYRVAAFVRDTPLGWMFVEPAARRKYAIGE